MLATGPTEQPDEPDRGLTSGLGRVDDPGLVAPEVPAGAIPRPRLVRMLDEAATHPVVLVSAGAGWGKTAAVAEWAAATRRHGVPVSWVTADGTGSDSAMLLRRVLWALRSTHEVVRTVADAVVLDGGLTDEARTAVAVALGRIARPAVLVVDNLEAVDDEDAGRLLAVLTAARTGLAVVLVSRSRPILGLHVARAAGRLRELGPDDLAFDPDEARRVADASGLALTSDDVARLLSRTEGWPVAVRLAVFAAAGSPAQPRPPLDAGRSLTEYLAAEVLNRQACAVQEFLLLTSVVQRLTPELAVALVPGARADRLLDGLERDNLFVERFGSRPAWFRYHPLLRQMLEEQLRQQDPDAHGRAHRTAAGWLAAHGDPLAALDHAIAVEDWELFGRLFAAAAAPGLVGPGREALRARLEAVPASVLATPGAGGMLAAARSFAGGALDAVGSATARARLGDPAGIPGRVLVALLESAASRGRGDSPGTTSSAQEALELLDAAPPFAATEAYRLIARNSRGVGRLWAGGLAAARDDLEWVASEPPRPDAQIAALNAASCLALCLLVSGDIDAAIERAAASIGDATVRGWSRLLQLRTALVARAWAQLLRGEPAAAEDDCSRAQRTTLGGIEPPPAHLMWAVTASTQVAQGRLRAARTSLGQLEGLPEPAGWIAAEVLRATTETAVAAGDVGYAHELLASPALDESASPARQACRARLLVLVGELGRADDAATAVLATDPESLPETVAQVEAALVAATLAYRAHRAYEAVQATRRACDIARAPGLVHPFLATFPEVSRVVRLLHESSADPDPFVTQVAGRLDRAARLEAPSPRLTERELQVLMGLARMRSNAEIADELVLSANTVKAHLKSVYRKLGVVDRRAAVREARAVGLLP